MVNSLFELSVFETFCVIQFLYVTMNYKLCISNVNCERKVFGI